MQGKILDFSVQTNSGIISGDDQQRYSFAGSEWKEQQPPKRGMSVDFDVNTEGHATAIYAALPFTNTGNLTQRLHEKNEDQYSPFDWFLKCIKNYVNLQGRARRQEYWFFILFFMLGAIAAMILDYLFGTEILFYALYILGMALPQLGVTVRRLHDIGKSGWWYLICLIPIVGIILLIIWLVKEGDAHSNLYGQPVK
ncbi:DUF805 domain-containing protein [Acinetobacter johnsonii]|jgi:uncharacterized membrane protein YhaH (DUF805 family)|nr:DUF805 domain-containing protein [Acinetobacter johnsonii]